MDCFSWIAGEWRASATAKRAESINPATGESVGSFDDADEPSVRAAIAAASSAFYCSNWSSAPRLRATVLLQFADLLEADRKQIAALLTAEHGKPIAQSLVEVDLSVSELRYYAGLARNIFGRVIELDSGLYSMIGKEPAGVTAIIVPWNAPIILMIRSLAPALAAGCTCVIKAAPQTALTSAAVLRLLAQVSDLPAGAVNSFSETGHEGAKLLVESPDVRVISYTGSTQVGKQIAVAATATMKRVNLELGGSAPVILLGDADLESAVPQIVRAAIFISGQQCVAASRLLVSNERLQETKTLFARSLMEIVVGPGSDPGTQMGPMIDHAARDRILRLLDAVGEPDEIVVRGSVLGGDHAVGAFVTPSLVHVRDPQSPLITDEIFGPILTLQSFDTDAEALERANASRFGLAASVWSADLARAQRLSRQIEAGTVWINMHGALHPEVETGGYKESGVGRLHGIDAMNEFLQSKHTAWTTK
ncbi:MAG: aldehyde dehydrogenase family protein [Brevundimonas sp.]|nr:aldehyde dehydrogenase family protein [Brevundimonas sp.]